MDTDIDTNEHIHGDLIRDVQALIEADRQAKSQAHTSTATSGEAILHIYAEVKGWLISLAKLMTWLLIANWVWTFIF